MAKKLTNNSINLHSLPIFRARLCGVFRAGFSRSAVVLLLAIVCSMAACRSREHSSYHSVGADGWAYADTLCFHASESDSTDVRHGAIAVALRHNNNYEYSNLWLQLMYTAPDTVYTDTLNITLADNFGNWYGSGLGISYQLVDTVLKDVTIDASKPLMLKHIMRADTLLNIEQVGLIFVEDKK